MARFLRQEEDGKAGCFAVVGEEVAAAPTADLPLVWVGV